MRPERVVTLPPAVTGADALAWARRARLRGASLLEVRTDLHPEAAVDLAALAGVLPLVVAERGAPVPTAWSAGARWVDRPLGAPLPPNGLASLHAEAPLTPAAAEALWAAAPLPRGALVKHVEPLGEPRDAVRLFETRRRLQARFGPERVTVLATGPLALPFRAALAPHNRLDYLAAEPGWSAAPGQRRLDDAVRASRAPSAPRRGILGSGLASSRSPRLHPPPFERLDLPSDAPVERLLPALLPHYLGLAVTSPFKKRVAAWLGGGLESVNTLVRRQDRWEGHDTDQDGARAALRRLGSEGPVGLLGDGGAAVALRAAASAEGRACRTLSRATAAGAALPETLIWTWPPGVEAPEGLVLGGRRVGVIAYGAVGDRVAARIRQAGGRPVRLGVCWLLAQAARQRRLWESAT